MKSNPYRASGFLLSPETKKRFDEIRMTLDVIGLGGVYIFGPYIPTSYQWLVSFYVIFAWSTIFTINPSRLPEATTTKKRQRQGLMWGLAFLPFYVLIVWIFYSIHTKPYHFPFSIPFVLGLIINAVFYETYFRNIAQAMLRKWGLPYWGAIICQSLLFGLLFYPHHPIFVPVGSVAIGLMSGWISYKTRSIQWNLLVMVAWLIVVQQ